MNRYSKTNWCFVTYANDNNGNGGVFTQIYDIVFTPEDSKRKSEFLLSEDFKVYCYENIHGLSLVEPRFDLNVFFGAHLYFQDAASLAWFKLQWE